jgi:hypothetical protein
MACGLHYVSVAIIARIIRGLGANTPEEKESVRPEML